MESWTGRWRPALFDALEKACQQIDQDVAQQESRPVLVSHGTQTDPVLEHANLAHVSEPSAAAGKDKDWKIEYARLSAKYNALSSNFRLAKDALEKRRAERDGWKHRADALEGKIQAFEREQGRTIISRRDLVMPAFSSTPQAPGPAQTNNSVQGQATSSIGRKRQADVVDTQEDTTSSSEGQAVADQMDELPPLLRTDSRYPVQIKREVSSDTLHVVAERAVKKQRNSGPVEERGHQRVKAEATSSSSPLSALERYHFEPHESPDLGDVAQRILTPRKRRTSIVAEDTAISAVAATGGTEVPLALQDSTTAVTESHMGGPRVVLKPIDGNRGLSKAQSAKDPARKTDLARAVGSIAEDGVLYSTGRKSARRVQENTSGAAKSRLDTLLCDPVHDEPNPISRTPVRLGNSPRILSERLPLPRPRELPFDRTINPTLKRARAIGSDSPQLAAEKSPRTPNLGPMPGPATGAVSPLRMKPASELRLDDFKINPAANHGHDYAFSEVVRNKDDRSSLPGCTDPYCCGPRFRALAKSQRPDSPLSDTERMEEMILLERYLGDEAWRLASMDKAEKKELWVEAKTHELANKYGKHRHRFSRMQSPPGFWNADFPSTQEMEAEKREATKRERQAVIDRHRQAMRSGGLWKFRDE